MTLGRPLYVTQRCQKTIPQIFQQQQQFVLRSISRLHFKNKYGVNGKEDSPVVLKDGISDLMSLARR